jgi:hypothetical protein
MFPFNWDFKFRYLLPSRLFFDPLKVFTFGPTPFHLLIQVSRDFNRLAKQSGQLCKKF